MTWNASDWEPTPSYAEFLLGLWKTYHHAQSVRPEISSQAESHWIVFGKNWVGAGGLAAILGLAVGLTALRICLNSLFLQPIARACGLSTASQVKMSESAWKLAFYTTTTCWACYSAVFNHRYFQKPTTPVSSPEQDAEVPRDVELLYAFEMGYYLHALYALYFMDTWKKDSNLLIFHHLLTMYLIAYSYSYRYIKVGVLIVLLHDCCDVFLESGKVLSAMRYQNGKIVPSLDMTANLVGVLFFLVWCICRLYFFPLRVIHAVHTDILHHQKGLIPFFYPSYLLGLSLLALNIYWTWLIVKLLTKFFTRELPGIEDIREYEMESEPTKEVESSQQKKKIG